MWKSPLKPGQTIDTHDGYRVRIITVPEWTGDRYLVKVKHLKTQKFVVWEHLEPWRFGDSHILMINGRPYGCPLEEKFFEVKGVK